MATSDPGTQDTPFSTQQFEHWHAWETEPDCLPEQGIPMGTDNPGGEGAGEATDQISADSGRHQ
eukprot:2004124-Heterocapsa_arctica.AAC.1